MHKLTVLFIFLSICAINSANEAELKLVSVIFRHGARTTSGFYPNDPHKDEKFYPFGLGSLTNVGKMGEYELGRYLNSMYSDFLGEDYTEDKVYVRSTDLTRTKTSAQLVLAGLFPPSEALIWNQDLLWIPIPVDYKTIYEEDLFHPTESCPYKIQALSNLPNIDEVQETYIKPYEELFSFIQNKSGKAMKVPSDAQELFFILECENEWNLTLPEWTEDVYPEQLANAAIRVYSYHNYDPILRKINSGYHLKKILDDFKSKIDGTLSPSERRLFLYSGHESTLGYMLEALKQDVEHIPPYGSALAFELWENTDNQTFVKLQYRNRTDATTAQDLILPGCDLLCPYDTVLEILNYTIPTESIENACKTNTKEFDEPLIANNVKEN